MSVQTKQRILDRINGTNAVTELEAVGTVTSEVLEMPIHLVLKGMIEASGLKPGEDCEVTDFVVKGDGVQLKFLRGKFEKVGGFIPQTLVDLLTENKGPIREGNFKE